MLIKVVVVIQLLLFACSQIVNPIDAIGTVLPKIISTWDRPFPPFRAFNNLMKQSLPLVPYKQSGRCWSCTLNFINGLNHQYPANLSVGVWAVAQIQFLAGNDNSFVDKAFNVKFQGNGTIGVYQLNISNITWSNPAGGQFILKATNQSLFVYIYATNPANPVKNISITLATLGSNPPTYTTNFLTYLKPFKILRSCFWQAQSLYNSNIQLQIWNNRTLTTSSTQISSTGVALEHILELETAAGATLWPCIPDTADTNYIIQMASLLSASRNKSKLIYLEYGNVYTIMNDFPDAKTNPIFQIFLQAYGIQYRKNILFTINYKDVQYYINAMGMRNSPINFTYIDAIGFAPNFGILDIGQVWNGTVNDIKGNLTNQMLSYEVTVNKAYQLSKRNKTNLITYSGGPYIKTYNYGYIWKNSTNSSYSANATIQLALANTLNAMNLNDTWVGEFYLQWLARLKSMGITSVLFSQLVGGAFTLNTDIVPLVPFLNMTTPAYSALSNFVLSGKKTKLPISGTVPTNPFICKSGCVWGDCIKNVCVCYAGYSGANCSTYTTPVTQNKIGTNLQGISYWTSQHPFIDLQRQGSDWVYFYINQGWNSALAQKNQVPLDTNGYPTYLPPGVTVGTLIARDLLTHYDPGNYTILYDGDGILNFGMFDIKKIIYGIGKCTIQVLPSTNFNNGILITIQRTNPNNYIRNIRVIRPGYENTWWSQTFSPLLLEKIAPYGTLRFMDWVNTNSQTDSKWADRVQLSSRTYTKNGVAWQQAIHLANILGKNAWINIPYLADSNYIFQLANLFLNKLEPHLKVYVEYSNQVWGTLFPGGQYAQSQGVTFYKNKITDPTQARFCWYALITKNISDIWKSVWSSNLNRLKIVASTQAVNADTTKRILTCENLYTKVDLVAIAPYINFSLNDSISIPTALEGLNAQLATIANLIKTHLNITNGYNLPLSCYESGQGIGGYSSNIKTFSLQTNDRMRLLYNKYFQTLFNNSIVLANHFTDSGIISQYGSWGIFQYTDERLNASAKWNGTVNYLIGQKLPISLPTFGSCSTLNCSGNGFCNFGRCVCYGDYTGSNCQIPRYIDFVDCGYYCTFNQGVCLFTGIVGINRYFSCTCNQGYTGAYCSIPICQDNCNYNGTCSAPNICTCFRGKMGTNCSIDCGCGGHGSCKADGTCLCDAGFVFNTTSRKCQFSCYNQLSVNCYGPNLKICKTGCIGGTCKNGTCNCWAGFTGVDCSTEVPTTYLNANLGINLGGLSYWSTQHLFKDYFKQSSTWIPQYYPGYFPENITYTWNTGEYFPKQPNGYPSSLAVNQSVAKLLLRDINLHYPSINQTNEYVLLYDGDGVIQLGFDATSYEYSTGRIRFRVFPSTIRDNGIYVRLIKTNPANPIKNIRVVLSRDEYNFQKDLLSQNFLTFINQFSTIRFMDLLNTNGNPVKQWNQTTRPDQDTQAMRTGISIQLLAKIVKRTGRNLWINIPHMASNDYITKFAQYLKASISSNRLIYIEYSNQVWNTFFQQGKYAAARATSLGLANPHKFYARRSLQIFNIFSSVFGAGYPQLRFVVSYQSVSKWVADQILNGTGLIGVAHIIAGAPYYDCDNIGNTSNTAYYATLTPNDVINRCNNSLSTIAPTLQIEKNISTQYNLAIGAYQAGTSISEQQTIYNGNENPTATVNFIAANRVAGMYDVYKKLLYTYKSNNFNSGAPLNLFSSIGTPSKYGSWGLLDYLDQVAETPTHPKFQAVIDFNQGL